MTKGELLKRTTPEADGLDNPFFAKLSIEVVEMRFGRVEIRPSFLDELPYRSVKELEVEKLVIQHRRKTIEHAILEAKERLGGWPDDDHTILQVALFNSMDEALNQICDKTGVGDEISKEMLLDVQTLYKWLRSLTVLSLYSKIASYEQNQDLVSLSVKVSESILGDQNTAKWKKSKQREDFQYAFDDGETGLIQYLQNYVDTFDE